MRTLRFRHSWTRWRRRRQERRLERELKRLGLLKLLAQEQTLRVQRLEAQLYPPEARPVWLAEAPVATEQELLLPPEPEPALEPEPQLEPLTPEERAELERQTVPGEQLLAQELGLSLPQMSSRASAS